MKKLLSSLASLSLAILTIGCDKYDEPIEPNKWPCPKIIEYEDRIYHTVQIGNQCWLKENLDVGTMITGVYSLKDNGIKEKYCYNDAPLYCDRYGGLYQWNEAMQYSNIEGSRGICPEGWHIPTSSEIRKLFDMVGNDGNALKAMGEGIGEGEGTNTSGFSALLAGSHGSKGYYQIDSLTAFWSSTQHNRLTGAEIILLFGDRNDTPGGIGVKSTGFSVRCLKD